MSSESQKDFNEGITLDIKPTEEELNKLQEALSYLAESISGGIKSNKATLDEIIQKVGLNSHHDWVRDRLERACPILERAHSDVRGTEKDLIITELEALGMKKFPAILTYDKARPQPFSVEPRRIDFGCLKLGEEANTTLKVIGGVVKEASAGKRLKLNLLKSSDGSTLIKVIASGGSAGESFQDYLIIKSDKSELKIPVNVRWEKLSQKPPENLFNEKEPPQLSWCPTHGDVVGKKCLFFNTSTRQYECFYGKEIYPYLDKRVTEYNNKHH